MSEIPTYCCWCGKSSIDAPAGVHESCLRRAQFEPPRYCAGCARRMVVQVNPFGWRARCSEHGEITSAG